MSLDDLCSSDGIFRVLAVDHRDSLRVFLAPDAPESVSAADLTAIKVDLVRAISPLATGVMLEPEYSIPQVVEAGALSDGVGFLAALESQGYLADPGAAPTTILDGWSVEQAAASGAAAAKLLLPYHPDHHLADRQAQVAVEVLSECRRVGLPLALEPLFHSLTDPSDRARVVLATAERFAAIGPDLLKLPFPVDPTSGRASDQGTWVSACRSITERCSQPWALLSGGGSFESFERQTIAALDGGASGFMVGRALWGEAARATDPERADLIRTLVTERWHRLLVASGADPAFSTP